MSVTINYEAGLPSLGSYVGLLSYLNHYEATFSQPSHAGTGGFSTANSTTPVINGVTYYAAFADKQYASETTSTSQTSAFIAEAGVLGGLDQLVYTYFGGVGGPPAPGPTHTLLGPLEKISFGSGLQFNGGTGLWDFSGADYITVTGLNSVLNAGLSGGVPIYWATGNNDIHNVIFPLMGGLGGPGSTSGLRDVFDDYGTTVIGTNGNDRFDGFAAADLFVTNGGYDLIFFFDDTQDQADVSTYGFANVTAALATATYDPGFLGVGATFITGSSDAIALVGYSGTLSAGNLIV